MKIMIGIPCMDTVPTDFVKSLLYLRKGNNTTVLFRESSLIYDARNLISLTAIEQGFDCVLWLDSDMVFNPDTLEILLDDMSKANTDMITGLYVKRYFPSAPVIYDRLDEPGTDGNGNILPGIHLFHNYPKHSVFKVAGCGFGCVLTTTRLLKRVWDTFGPAFSPLPWAGEDLAFCYRVNQLGVSIYCDSGVSCGHVGKYVFQENDLERERKRGE